ncbi:MAG: V-type ATP synthase subunit A, partial [Treponema sp.]|nr:V-type ATP synthase subunit A [Treponema sp.]
MIEGRVRRISGPIIRATGLGGAGLFDVVEVGEKRIIGEIVRLEGNEAIIQVYEDNTGLKTGAPALSTGRPLSALLGPGLMGTIYDGIQRPLELLFSQSGAFMTPGERGDPLDTKKKWHFVPDAALCAKIASGAKVPAVVGTVLGTVQETQSVSCKIMVPPGTKGGDITSVIGEGDYTVLENAAKTSMGEEIPIAQWWPVRLPRPSAERLSPDQPLI